MLLRRIARPLFASWFLSEGTDALRRPAGHAAAARATLERVTGVVPRGALGGALEPYRHPSDAQIATVVRVHGAATTVAALLLATGRRPRTAALALAALTVPLAVADAPLGRRGRGGAHAGPATAEERRERSARFVRALGFTGGALLAAADTAGRPGLSWRVQHARATRAAQAAAASTGSAVASAVRRDG